MCGFVGIIETNKEINRTNDMLSMLERIKHRGPDDSKTLISETNGVYLGFARLSMIDLESSAQPFYKDPQKCIVLFNGEIYNYRELMEEMINKGASFRTNGEVETILELYKYYGIDFVHKLDGMFSICIVDIEKGKTYIIRDRIGIKPLYYSKTGSSFSFFSELKSMPAYIEKKIDKKALKLYFHLRFVPSPFSIFENVKKVCAGEWICFDNNGNVTHYQYYKHNRKFETRHIDRLKIRNIIQQNIIDTYETSDVPIGLFLSGGIDSGIIAATLNNSVKTISLNNNEDEIMVTDAIINQYNLDAERLDPPDKVQDLLKEVIYYLDEPFYSSVSLSTFILSQSARKYVKGVLTGDGSDELIFGYKYIKDALDKDDILEAYLSGLGWVKDYKINDLLLSDDIDKDELYSILFDDCMMDDIFETIRRFEVFKRLPDYHLTRVDRLSMASGLEARVPYLRNSYIEYIMGIAPDSIFDPVDSKSLLKNSFSKLLPSELVNAPKKPFSAPIRRWIENDLKNDIERVFNDSVLTDMLELNSKAINTLLENYSGKYGDISNIWGLYLLLKWTEITFHEKRYA